MAVSAGVLTVAAGEAAATAGVTTVSAGVLIVAAGAAAAAEGVLAGSVEGALTVALGATATIAAGAAAQCSEIMFSSVAAKLLVAALELVPLALCPMRVTSWPRCALRSTLLVVILKMWPVLSSKTV